MVFDLLCILFIVGFFSIILFLKKRPQKLIDRNYEKAAKKFNLVLNKPLILDSQDVGESLNGILDNYSIKIYKYREVSKKVDYTTRGFKMTNNSYYHICYEATFHEDMGFDFSIRPGNAYLKSMIKTLDTHFDNSIYINTQNEAKVIGLLHYQARRIICDIKPYINRHDITFSTSLYGDITERLEKLTLLINILKRKGTAFEHLFENYTYDKNGNVRKQNFHLLLTYFSSHKDMKNIMEQALKDRNPFINFYAFKALKKDIDFHYLHTLWVRGNEQLTIEIIEYLAKNQNEAMFNFLVNRFNNAPLPVKIKIIQSCRMMGNEKQENFLVEQLKGFDNELIIAAIQNLGIYGNPAAIEPLFKIKNFYFKKYVKKAIRQIRTRYSIEKGQLSLVNEEDLNGSLSLSTDDE